jgi:hypothetical protein
MGGGTPRRGTGGLVKKGALASTPYANPLPFRKLAVLQNVLVGGKKTRK